MLNHMPVYKPGFNLLLLCVLASLCSTVLADTSVWEVKSGSSTVYLGGTIHMLRPMDYPLPEEYEQAYQASSKIYLETDLSSMTELSVRAQMQQQLTYQDERSLKTVLNEEAYSALSDYAELIGIPLAAMEKFKPGMVVSTLQVIEFQRMGFTPEGVDAYFYARAIGDAKTTGQLESVQDQIGFLASMGEGNESDFLLLSLRDLERTDKMMKGLLAAWRAGDNDQLAAIFITEMQSEAPDLYDSLLRQRNLKWVLQIEQMLNDSVTEFVLVGAAHLVGSDGLLGLLKGKGYQVTQL